MNIAASTGRWHAKAAKLSFKGRLFIDGDFREAISGAKFETINPANDSVIAAMSRGNAADIDLAVASGRKAFKSGAWSRLAPPFGGWEESGNGRDKCMDAILSYAQSKGVWVTIGN
jgi:gamma-glutamyl-gamma-aminobutyraldehyde dehydrogenase